MSSSGLLQHFANAALPNVGESQSAPSSSETRTAFISSAGAVAKAFTKKSPLTSVELSDAKVPGTGTGRGRSVR